MKWIIFFIFFIIGCGKDPKYSNDSGTVAQNSLGLGMNIPSFESSKQNKGFLIIPFAPETNAAIKFEGKNYLINNDKSSRSAVLVIQKLFRQQIDVRPYDQNSSGTIYKIHFVGRLEETTVIIESIYIY